MRERLCCGGYRVALGWPYEYDDVLRFDIADDGSSFFVVEPLAGNASRLVIHNLELREEHHFDLGTTTRSDHTLEFDLSYSIDFAEVGRPTLRPRRRGAQTLLPLLPRLGRRRGDHHVDRPNSPLPLTRGGAWVPFTASKGSRSPRAQCAIFEAPRHAVVRRTSDLDGQRLGKPLEVLRVIVGVARRRPAKLLYLLTSLGVSFGFIAAVVTIGHASWFHLPNGVAERDYVTVVRRTDSGAESVALVDLDNLRQLAPEVSWFYEMPLHDVRVRDPDGAWRSLAAVGASSDYFELLGVVADRGALVPNVEGGPAVVLSHRLWREMYGADEAAMGMLLDIEGGPPTPIVGVVPPDFIGMGGRWSISAWLLNPPPVLGMRKDESEEEAGVRFGRTPSASVFGVMRDAGGDTLAGLRSLLDGYRFVAEPVRFEREGPSLPPGLELPEGAITTSFVLMDFGVRDSDRLELVAGLEADPDGRREVVLKTTWLSGVVVLLLVMAFVALLEFLLAENVSREEEKNVRIAVGATPVDVFRQSLAENGVWILVVGLVGWFAFRYVVDVLLGIEPFAGYIGETTGSARLVGVGASGLLLVVAFLGCVAYLGWFVSRTTLAQSPSRTWTRRATRQVLAFVGLASLVFVFSLVGRYAGDARLSLGFRNTDVAIVGASREWGGLAMDTNIGVEAVESMPGARSAARADLMPLAHSMSLRFHLVEILGHPGLDDTPFHRNTVTPGYFATLGVDFLAGRIFEAESENEVVVSRSAAEALGGVDEILGLPLRLSKQYSRHSQDEVVVVGVVEDIVYGDSAAPVRRIVYSAEHSPGNWQQWVIDTEGDVDAVEVLRAMPEFEGWEISDGGTPASLFRGEFLARRSVEIMISVAAGFALLLALAGMANSLARSIVEDRSAIGIRFALGATGAELGRVYSATRVRDLIVAAVLVGVTALVTKLAASAFAAMLELWLLLPALACMVGLVALSGHVIVRRLANRHSVGALLQGIEGGTGQRDGRRVDMARILGS